MKHPGRRDALLRNPVRACAAAALGLASYAAPPAPTAAADAPACASFARRDRASFSLEDLIAPRKPLDRSTFALNAFANDPRFGTVRSQLAEAVRVLGARKLRVLFAWNDAVQPSPDSPINFSFYDDIARRIPRGAEALVVLTGVPGWMRDGANHVRGDAGRTFVERWVKPVTARYARNPRVTAYQIWNEPNDRNNPDNVLLGFTDSPAAYVKVLRAARGAVRRADRKDAVVSAAVTALNQNYPETLSYFSGMVRAGLERNSDVVAVHYYGKQFENVLRNGGVADVVGALKRPVWLTESGERGILSQREYVERVWGFLAERLPGVSRYYYYQFTDEQPAERSYGLKVALPSPLVSDLYVHLRDGRRP